MSSKPKSWSEYERAGGPVPKIGPIRDSFWAGYKGTPGVRMGVEGSVERRAFLAGKARAKVERNLAPTVT